MTNYALFSKEENLDEILDLMEKLSEKKIEIENIRFAISIIKLIRLENISSVYTMINDILSFIKETNINNINLLKDEEIIAKFTNINSIKMGLKCFLIKKIKKHKYGCNFLTLKESLPNLFSSIKLTRILIDELIIENKIEIFLDKLYIIKYPSILENLHEIVKRDFIYKNLAPMINELQNGKEENEISKIINRHPTTVAKYMRGIKQHIERYRKYNKDIIFKECIYEDIFRKYNIDRDEFIEIFDKIPMVYDIVDLLYPCSENLHFSRIQSDSDIPDEMKMKIREKIIDTDTKFTKNKKIDILEEFYINNIKKETSIKNIKKLYMKFLKEIEKDNYQNLYLEESVLRSYLERNNKILKNKNQEIRYYFNEYKIEDFIEKLNLIMYDDEKINSIDLFNKNQEIMKEYDLRDEMELYTFLKKNLRDNNYLYITFTKNIIIFPKKEKIYKDLYNKSNNLNLIEIIDTYMKKNYKEKIENILYEEIKKGENFEEINEKLNIKKLVLRKNQLITRIKRYMQQNKIEFKKSIYWQILNKYNISKEEFCYLFGDKKELFYIIKFLNKKIGKESFENLKNDFLFPGDIRKKVEDLKRKIS
ncbi:MAG: hypothetical protein MJH09_07735 [Cetobacterium sp.]|nr:hypothetical protein [Cetobacterium sp.]